MEYKTNRLVEEICKHFEKKSTLTVVEFIELAKKVGIIKKKRGRKDEEFFKA